MLEHNPALKERLTAVGVFASIFIMGALSVDALVTGKFDVLTPGAAAEAPAPQAWYDRPLEAGQGWYSEPYHIDAYVTQTSLTFEGDTAAHYAAEPLEGGSEARFTAAAAEYDLPDEAALQTEIDALYAQLERPSYGAASDARTHNLSYNGPAPEDAYAAYEDDKPAW